MLGSASDESFVGELALVETETREAHVVDVDAFADSTRHSEGDRFDGAFTHAVSDRDRSGFWVSEER